MNLWIIVIEMVVFAAIFTAIILPIIAATESTAP